MNLDTNNHSVFLLNYHLVLVIKYRKKVINDEIWNRLKETLYKLWINVIIYADALFIYKKFMIYV